MEDLCAWFFLRYKELFLNNSEEGEGSTTNSLEPYNQERCFPPYVWGRTISPDDQPAYFAAVIQATYGTGAPAFGDSSLVAKVIYSHYYLF